MVMRGFTLIELMIIVAIVGIIGAIVFPAATGTSGLSNVSFGVNGMTEMRCIDGYKFVISHGGGARQVLNEFGKGAKC